MLAPQKWDVEVWDPACDPGIEEIFNLWCDCMPEKYQLNLVSFQSILRRDGWVRHYVVREPGTREILGFCATYTTYIGRGTESLIGSLAAVIVRPSSRQRGVGLSLHDHALRQLIKVRGVERVQLGSTFPRLLFGLPVGTASEGWFRRRGWRMDGQGPGTGQEVSDWILRISDWPSQRYASSTAGLEFRPCEFYEYQEVLDMVGKQATRDGYVGWFDQYARLEGEMNIRDIVVGIADGTIIAAALTYVKNNQSYVHDDIPWPTAIGDDVAGITCICITGMFNRDTCLSAFGS
jgi:GNAT superfamily N-acetyltransferase